MPERTPAPMNRAARRKHGRRRLAGLTGASLFATTGLLGGYVGNPRLPRAYAITSGPCSALQGLPLDGIVSEADLRDAIDDVNEGLCTEIDLGLADSTSPITLNADLQPIISSVTITGLGPTQTIIDGGNSFRVFTFYDDASDAYDATSLEISGLTITLGSSGGGPGSDYAGALEVQPFDNPQVTVDISNVHFVGNVSQGDVAGAINVGWGGSGRETRLNVVASRFDGNEGGAGAVSFESDGSWGYLHVHDSEFTDNYATDLAGGGAIWATGSTVIQGSAFELNGTANGPGGAIRANSALTVEDTYFKGNSTQLGYVGGAIYGDSDPMTITSSTFIENSSSANGGAVSSRGPLTVTRSRFNNNEADDRGGAIRAEDTLSVDYTHFGMNSSLNGGGAIQAYDAASVEVSRSTFVGNEATYNVSSTAPFYSGSGGAVQMIRVAEAQFTNSTFYDNSANYAGGALANFGDPASSATGSLSIDFSTFTGNSAVNGSGGAVYQAFDHPWSITNSVLFGNLALGGTDVGWGATAPAASAPVTSRSMFSDFTTAFTGSFTPGTGDLDGFIAGPDFETLVPVNNGGPALGSTGKSVDTLTLKPRSVSPLIGRAAWSGSPASDQRGTGYVRGAGSIADMGAVEVTTTAPSPTPSPSPSPGGGGAATGEPVAPSAAPSPVASGTSVQVDPLGPLTNSSNPLIPATGVPAGQSVFLVDGKSTVVTQRTSGGKRPTGLLFSGDGMNMSLQGRGDTDGSLGLTSGQALVLESQQSPKARSGWFAKTRVQPVALSSGDGFKAKSPVEFYLLPGRSLGSLTTDASGAYKGSVPIPEGIEPGVYTLQVNGFAPSGAVRSLSLGVLVKAPGAAPMTQHASAVVLFDAMSSRLTPAGKADLARLARKVGSAKAQVIVVGLVQPSGLSSNDKSLSAARARAVAAYLKSLGVKGDYTVRGGGRASVTGAAARRVDVSINWAK